MAHTYTEEEKLSYIIENYKLAIGNDDHVKLALEYIKLADLALDEEMSNKEYLRLRMIINRNRIRR